MSGAKPLFETGRLSWRTRYLKPTKRLLVDLTGTKTGLDKAIAFANEFLLALEARDHRVVIAPNSEQFHRADVDERENPGKGNHHSDLWLVTDALHGKGCNDCSVSIHSRWYFHGI